jgi:serine/threonine-protein kinase RsbW
MEIVNHSLASTIENIDVAESAVVEVASRAGFADDALGRIALAVREIVANAVAHGNRYDARKKVYVKVSRTAERLEITIADQGDGFDLDSVKDPRSPEALFWPSGRGIYLARTFMDELYVRGGDFGGTTIVLVKHLKPELNSLID